MMAVGLTISGHHEIAYRILDRLFEKFVTKKGGIIDSSEELGSDEAELDQNGALLFALKNYVLWTDSQELIAKHWDKIAATAEFPLSDVFLHKRSGLLANRKEYWGRRQNHGIVKGMELAHQLFAAIGLSAASTLASLVSRESEASRWKAEAERIKNAMLDDSQYGLIDSRGFIKRRSIDGIIQEIVKPLPKAQLPEGVPLSSKGEHHLNPDATSVLPIAMSFIFPDSPLASLTLDSVEELWNQAWKDGGYGRYNESSELDSPGAWPFPSLFIARSYVETGDFDKMWRVVQWLNKVPGALSGSWFEFYGHRSAPAFSQVGITPWTWAEMLILLIHHIIGIQPEVDHVRIRPKLIPGIEKIRASFLLRDSKIDIEIKSGRKKRSYGFRSNGKIIQSSEKEAHISYLGKDLWIEASLP
jgi:GH15 family glucan-1,4-alpha-glucosidase